MNIKTALKTRGFECGTRCPAHCQVVYLKGYSSGYLEAIEQTKPLVVAMEEASRILHSEFCDPRQSEHHKYFHKPFVDALSAYKKTVMGEE